MWQLRSLIAFAVFTTLSSTANAKDSVITMQVCLKTGTQACSERQLLVASCDGGAPMWQMAQFIGRYPKLQIISFSCSLERDTNA